ncbi:MAG: hypothetical protein K2N94_00345, partial [Lachnospiraceae bacterium]|nr:hypothetical protein [Lachnospiraceae bacterium]
LAQERKTNRALAAGRDSSAWGGLQTSGVGKEFAGAEARADNAGRGFAAVESPRADSGKRVRCRSKLEGG